MRALLRQAAQAPKYDDHFSELFGLYLRGVRESGLEIPDVLGGPIRSTSSPDDPSFFVSYFEFQLRPVFQFGPFNRLCSSAAAQSDAELRADCVAFFEKAYAARGGLLHRRVGETVLRRLLSDPEKLAALVEDRRRYLWLMEQCPFVMEATPGPAELSWEQLMNDAAQLGEMDAYYLRAKRLGCGEGPHAEWKPRDPETLLLPEQRSKANP